MIVGLKSQSPSAGGIGDSGLSRLLPAQPHNSTIPGRIQAPSDFPDLRRKIEAAKAAGDYQAYCQARKELLLAQAAAYQVRL
jgi:hypothetical protein